MAIDKIFSDANVDGIADNIFGAVNNSVSEVKQMQQRKAAENVQVVVEALKKIETNITEKFDNVTDVIEKRVLTIKDGRDGSSGSDGRNGRDGKPGRDGVNGKQGFPGPPGKDGVDGVDGVSVTDANIDFDGSLVLSLSSGQQINVGEIVPPELERQLVELRQGGSAGSSGDVAGPTSSTDNAIVRFDGTTGKLVQNSVVTIADTTGNMAGVGTLGAGAITATSLVSSGTAASSFTVTSGSAVPLTITNVGTGNSFVVEDAASTDSTPFVIANDGRTSIGFPNTITAAQLGIAAVDTTFDLFINSNNATGVAVRAFKNRNTTFGSHTIVQNGDSIETQQFFASDGVTNIQAASIAAAVDGTPGTNDMPGRLVFSTTADGASSPTERMRIDAAGNVGIGVTASAGRTLQVAKNITGSTFSVGVTANGTVQSDVTVAGIGYSTSLSTQATAFTAGLLYHYYASQGTIGAGSTVTDQRGYVVETSLTGATNNYGFLSNIAAAANRFNFYANGTAANYFAGVTQFAAGTAALPGITQISDLNTGIYFPAADTLGFTTGGTERVRIDSAGNVGIGSNPLSGGAKVTIGGNATGATSAYGLINTQTIQTDVTSQSFGFATSVSTAASVTLSSLFHYLASQATFSGTSVTNQYGFSAQSNITGATNNYGYYSNIASGTNRFNFYANGTADNYFAGSVGIGTTPLVNYKLLLGGSLTGSANQASQATTMTIASDVTNSYRGYYSAVNTAASAFTLTNLAHFRADQGTIGATSAVTNQFGYTAESTLTGATNNYGYYSNIASGTNRFNFYANGTADNYFAGKVGIGTLPIVSTGFAQTQLATGAVTCFGQLNTQTAQSDVTTSLRGYNTTLSTAAAVFTLSDFRHYAASQGTIGAGSTLTSQYGFIADSFLTGATNNYGVFSNIAAAANRFNFYAQGTAINYFAGVVQTNAATAIPAGGTAGAGVTVSSTANFGVFFGSGAPTLSAAKGSLYLRSDGSTTTDRMYVNTNGSTTWTNVVTSA